MTPAEIYDAVILQSDITLSELPFDQIWIEWCIRQAVVDVMVQELLRGDYNVGSMVYSSTGIIQANGPLDSYAGGSITGLPLYGTLWYVVWDTGARSSYPLLIESAYLMSPYKKRLVYMPPDIFVSALAMPSAGSNRLRHEYACTLVDNYMASISVGGNLGWENVKQTAMAGYNDLLLLFTARTDEGAEVEVRYWREPEFRVGMGGIVEIPALYHGQVVARGSQLVTQAVQYLRSNVIQSVGGVRVLQQQAVQQQKEEQT